jgi:hypothetical protein
VHHHKYVFNNLVIAKGEMNMHPYIANGGAGKGRNAF